MNPQNPEPNLEKMELADRKTDRSSNVYTNLEIRIEDFRECNELKFLNIPKDFELRYSHKNLEFGFYVAVYPNGLNKETEGWLTVFPEVRLYDSRNQSAHCGVISGTVSITDIEGNSRFPRSFQRYYAKERIFHMPGDIAYFFPEKLYQEMLTREDELLKYLERSFILNRADEFLSEGVLTVRCDFCSDLNAIVSWIASEPLYTARVVREPFKFSLCSINKAQTGALNDTLKANFNNVCLVFDFTFQVLTLPQFHESRKRFDVYGIPPESPMLSSDSKEESVLTLPQYHESRKRFGVYGIPPEPSSLSSKSKEISTDELEHIWMFGFVDNICQRFLLSLDERQDSLGTRLLQSSPVIRRMVNTDMRERRENCIELPNVKGKTFQRVLLFLVNGRLNYLQCDEVLDVYEFSHFFEMIDLQRICVETIVKAYEFEEVERIIDLYSDEYLSGLLESRRLGKLEEPLFKMEDIPNSDCYI
ncbi:hypothetical protein AVEN_211292-1 [Araneus ventricosus]|uniref:BTB domain-containing protein n=1 Tax=Araneus ventricosus TaxID=182803 RepID=A0A4Y2HPB8_ARAVE|nr:hypothetical protein AVEN_211292-1 [Araneus ventricosus]